MAHRIQRTKRRSSPRQLRLALLATTTALLASAPSVKAGNEWHIVGTSGVSAQQLFRMENGDVMIIDKVENNPLRLNGAPGTFTMSLARLCPCLTNALALSCDLSFGGSVQSVSSSEAKHPYLRTYELIFSPDTETNTYEAKEIVSDF